MGEAPDLVELPAPTFQLIFPRFYITSAEKVVPLLLQLVTFEPVGLGMHRDDGIDTGAVVTSWQASMCDQTVFRDRGITHVLILGFFTTLKILKTVQLKISSQVSTQVLSMEAFKLEVVSMCAHDPAPASRSP